LLIARLAHSFGFSLTVLASNFHLHKVTASILDANGQVCVAQRMSGGEFIGFNNAVFLSERENADRNYALAFYMRENKCFPEKINLRECLDFYFQVKQTNVIF
jgi:glutaminase